jgi:hypothetical protein
MILNGTNFKIAIRRNNIGCSDLKLVEELSYSLSLTGFTSEPSAKAGLFTLTSSASFSPTSHMLYFQPSLELLELAECTYQSLILPGTTAQPFVHVRPITKIDFEAVHSLGNLFILDGYIDTRKARG